MRLKKNEMQQCSTALVENSIRIAIKRNKTPIDWVLVAPFDGSSALEFHIVRWAQALEKRANELASISFSERTDVGLRKLQGVTSSESGDFLHAFRKPP
jgi:hypothetical protein